MAKPLVRVIMNNMTNRVYGRQENFEIEDNQREEVLLEGQKAIGSWNVNSYEEALLKDLIKGANLRGREVGKKAENPVDINLISLEDLVKMYRKNRGSLQGGMR